MVQTTDDDIRARGPSTILFLAANPVQTQRLQLDEECRTIKETLLSAKHRDQIRFCSSWAARPADLMRALNESSPAVLHFSGHGAGDQGLCFQSEDGSAVSVSADVLGQVMRVAGGTVTVVFLNACYSETQAKALTDYIPCVIGMYHRINDQAAIVYAESFYSAVAAGMSVQNAHQQGLTALTLPSSGGQARDISSCGAVEARPSPTLLTRLGIDADRVYIVPRAKKRCLLVVRARMEDMTPEVLARITEMLRQYSGDLSLRITDIEEGSVRLTLMLSAEAAQTLEKLKERGQLTQVCGYDVSDFLEMPANTSQEEIHAAPSQDRVVMHQPQVAARRDVRVAELRRSGDPSTRAKSLSEIGERSMDADSDILRMAGAGDTRGAMRGLEIDERSRDADSDILRMAVAGDMPGAIRGLMLRHGRSMYRYCREALADPTLADDVQQQVFIEAYRDLATFAGRSTVRTWLFAIARHRVLDAVKSRSRARAHIKENAPADAADPTPPTDERIDDTQLARALSACVARLPEPTRTAMLLRYQQGFTFEEMAVICGEKAGTLQARVMRALPLLRDCIEGRTGRRT